MTKGTLMFEETRRCLIDNEPDAINGKEINLHCNNFSKLSSLMDIMFSTLHSKRGDATSDKINMLKTDLNLVRIK